MGEVEAKRIERETESDRERIGGKSSLLIHLLW